LERFIEIIKMTENYWINIAKLPSQAADDELDQTEIDEDKPPKGSVEVIDGPDRHN
jgi:hypothetical protein